MFRSRLVVFYAVESATELFLERAGLTLDYSVNE